MNLGRVEVLLVILIVSLLLYAHEFSYNVNGESMRPDIRNKEQIFVSPLSFRKEIKHKDIIIFNLFGEKYVKRVLAIPSDTMKVKNGVLYVNSDSVKSLKNKTGSYSWHLKYLAPEIKNDLDNYRFNKNHWGPIKIPKDHFFIIGDNIDNSFDSRHFGLVKRDSVIGVKIF